MKKEEIIVPRGIRYISDWTDFSLIEYPHILDKQIPGCGFTQYCITNSQNIILCSPRRILLDNKSEQNPDVFYFKNEYEKPVGVDKDLDKRNPTPIYENNFDNEGGEIVSEESTEFLLTLRGKLRSYILHCLEHALPCKILVTYDSFRHVKEVISGLNLVNYFYTVIDEFQSIFTDSRFKSDTEMGLLGHLRDLSRLCFVSATPMMDKYLDMLDEFKNLPYFRLDWKTDEPGRLLVPSITVKQTRSITSEAMNIIVKYKNSRFAKAMVPGTNEEVESKEAVFYVNSVKNIISIIKKTKLQPEEINILCANTTENANKIKRVLGKKYGIGKVPTRGEVHKMFTFCTRTVYLGADFYSTNARSFIMSDANITSMAVDITLDLPQILGRQRLDENPWNNRAELYVKVIMGENRVDPSVFTELIEDKLNVTKDLLISYDYTPKTSQHSINRTFLKMAKTFNYKDNYVAVNTYGESSMTPLLNKLVLVAEMRAFEIQQIDYADRFSVFRQIQQAGVHRSVVQLDSVAQTFLDHFFTLTQFPEKMQAVCEFSDTYPDLIESVFSRIDPDYERFLKLLGHKKIKSNCYQKYRLNKCCEQDVSSAINKGDDLAIEVYKAFQVGSRYTLVDIKRVLSEIYINLGYTSVGKGSDLLNYFELKKVKLLSGSIWVHGFELLSKKL